MARPYSIISEVRTKIKELQEHKANELESIAIRKAEVSAEADQAAQEMESAAARLDLEAYEKAKTQEAKARTACEMLSARYEQIRKQEYVSNEESDRIISELLEHERQLEQDFKKAVSEHNQELSRLHSQYRQNVADVESVLHTWTQEIHANYISDTATYSDGMNRTHRATHPVPVHATPYDGCREANQLQEYLTKACME